MSSKKSTPPRKSSMFKSKVDPILSKMGSRILQEKFFKAIDQRNVPEIITCLDRGIDPNVRSAEYGVSPLHILAERNDYVLGYRILECRDVLADVRSSHGFTPLHIASMLNCKKFINVLLQKGADLNLPDRFQKTALHLAIEGEHYGVVLKLLKAGAKVNTLDCFENSPLSLSLINVCNLLIAKTLFQYGASLYYEHRRSLHIFFELILHCRTIDQIDFVELVLQNGATINMRDETTGRNCLHFVAITGYLELAVYLIERGAKWMALDTRKRTPAKVAMEHGNLIIAEYFRKGYRPGQIFAAIPGIQMWTRRLKQRLEEKHARNE